MDSSSRRYERASSPPSEERSASADSNPGNPRNTIGRDLTAFGRTVTATAGQLIGPYADNGHYSPMGDVTKQLSKRPSIQKRMLSFNHRSPTELMRSKLSTAEIQHRALTHVPDDMLVNIPAIEHAYSLFQGFQATVPDESGLGDRGRSRHRRLSGKHRVLEEPNRSVPDGPPTLSQMNREKAALTRQLEMLAIRKNMSSAEIREIDMKISNLNQMRNIVFDRLAQLEQEESEVEHEIVTVENKIEELEDEFEIAGIGEHHASPAEHSSSEDTQGEEGGEFMSQSIYGKIPTNKHPRKRRSNRRMTKHTLHEHMEPGHKIEEMQTHTDTITSLDFDVPFGTLVTAALDDTVRVWDLNSGKCLGMLEGHHASVRCLQVQDSIVATGSVDASIRLWDLSKADSYKYTPPSTAGGDSDEGLAREYTTSSMSDCHILTLDAHIDEVTALYFQGDMLVSGSADKTLRQWDLEKGRCVQTLDVLWAAAQSSMDDGKWRTSGGRVAGGDSGDFVGALQCFDAALACGTADGMVRLWDLRSGQVHRSLVGHTGPVTALQFDDVHLVTGSLDRSIRIWDLRTGSIFDAFGYDNPVTSMQFDTRRICSAAGETAVKVYDKTDGRHWDCGAGLKDNNVDRAVAVVDRVRVRDGYLVEGRRDGIVGVWAC